MHTELPDEETTWPTRENLLLELRQNLVVQDAIVDDLKKTGLTMNECLKLIDEMVDEQRYP